jgi:hypothetical protein
MGESNMTTEITTDAERDSFLASIKTKIDAGGITQPEVDLIRLYAKARFNISLDVSAHDDGRASFSQRRYLHTLREQGFAEPFADDISYQEASALIDAAQAKKKTSEPSRLERKHQKAVDWLKRALQYGPVLSTELILDAKGAEGITEEMLRRAKDELKVTQTRVSFTPGKARYYMWSLPEVDGISNQAVESPLSFGEDDLA